MVTQFLLLAQVVDPSPFASSFGVPLGALIFVIVVLCGIITGIVWRGEANRLATAKQVMDFVAAHQKDSHDNFKAMSESMKISLGEVSKALNRQSRGFDWMMTTGQILERIEDAKRRSPTVELSTAEITAIAQQVYTQFRDLDASRT